MNKHTPTPWRVDEDGDTDILDKDGFCIVSGEEPFAILHGYAEKLNIPHWADSEAASREISEEESRANIAHIVRCVNSHEALVKALQRFVAYGDVFGYRKGEESPYEQACTALAAAGVQP